jgi:hypothetical protein
MDIVINEKEKAYKILQQLTTQEGREREMQEKQYDRYIKNHGISSFSDVHGE